MTRRRARLILGLMLLTLTVLAVILLWPRPETRIDFDLSILLFERYFV